MLIKKAFRNLLLLMDEQQFTIKTAFGATQCGPNGCRPMATPPPSTAGTPEVQARNREAYQARENDRLARLAQARKEWQERNPASMVPQGFNIPTSTGVPTNARGIQIDPRYGGGYGFAGSDVGIYTPGGQNKWQAQALQYNPRIGQAGTPENQLFVQKVKALNGQPFNVRELTDAVTKQVAATPMPTVATPNAITGQAPTAPPVVTQVAPAATTPQPTTQAAPAAVTTSATAQPVFQPSRITMSPVQPQPAQNWVDRFTKRIFIPSQQNRDEYARNVNAQTTTLGKAWEILKHPIDAISYLDQENYKKNAPARQAYDAAYDVRK